MLVVLITAAGSGSRFGSELPKQFHKINGDMILQKTLNCFKNFENILVTIRKEDEDFFKNHFPKISYVTGGETRQNSVFKGLLELAKLKPEFVLITDGARPFVSKNLINSVIMELEKGEKGVIPCIKLTDTIKSIKNGYVSKTFNRDELSAVQTPQGFEFELILNLHKKHQGKNFSDDSLLLEEEGILIKAVEGEKSNLKITTKEDLKFFL